MEMIKPYSKQKKFRQSDAKGDVFKKLCFEGVEGVLVDCKQHRIFKILKTGFWTGMKSEVLELSLVKWQFLVAT